jgi:beta-xylosidase
MVAGVFAGVVLAMSPAHAEVLDLPLKKANGNPIFKTDGGGNLIFTADPAVLVDGDTLYVYAGQDEAAIGGWFNMNRWVCYSTKDMADWKYEGVVLWATDFSWGTPGTAWACQVVKKNGKYYFYSTTGRPDRKGFTVGVAVSDHPAGPFIDVKKAPLFDNKITTGGPADSIEDIDPTVFVDDDGQAYIYWGNGTIHHALLADDMMSIKDLNGDGKITEGADIFTDKEAGKTFPGYGEAPWLCKRNGKYYLVYAAGLPQKVVYAMSSSPRGPWEYQGVILDENLRPDGSRSDFNSDTSHPALVTFKGQSYVFYHTAAQPTGGQTRRSVAVERISYNTDGTIRRSEITSMGLTGKASRIQSLRHQDQFVRFTGFDVKLEKPGADGRPFLWEFTLGLAEEAAVDTVAIQVVSHPGYYLIVNGQDVILAKHDNTAGFRRNATFKVTPGLADKKGVSFQSLADPRLFLRQTSLDGRLRAAAVSESSNPTDKEDATFKLP